MNRIVLTIIVILLMISGCDYFIRKPGQKPVAKVDSKYLYESDLAEILPQNVSPGDSAIIVQKYIDSWIRKELMLKKAEANLSEREKSFERQIADYRASLIIFKYQQQLLNQKLDTFISNRMILDFYEENASNFILDRNAVRGMFVKVPRSAPNIDKIKSWYRNEDDTPLLESYGYQFAVKYDYFNDDWIYFETLLNQFPFEIPDEERFLRNNPYIEAVDSVYYYFAGIRDYKLSGTVAPVSIVRDNIRSIIMNKRKIEFLLDLEKNIYNEALAKSLFEVYYDKPSHHIMFRKSLIVSIASALLGLSINAQPLIIDRVVAVVGKNTILQSEIEAQLLQMKAQGMTVRAGTPCEVLEDLLIQKLMINQAVIDSVEVTNSDVEMQLNSRLQYFIRQIGSEQALEDYYNKSILEIKEDLRDIIRDQMITQEMQSVITADVKVTPSEVRSFFNKIPSDSLPMINSQVQVRQILIYPEYSETEKFEVKERLNNLRQRIINGEDFNTLAILYSQDPGTARRGGELGFVSRSDVVPAFANVAFSLRDNRVSQVFETEFGFHIVQLVERRGDLVNCRHILMLPSASAEARSKSRSHLDSIADLIRKDSLTFRLAAARFSNHEESRMSGGLMINPNTNSSRWELDQLTPADYLAIKDLKVGELSNVFEARDDKGKIVYKLLQLSSQTPPHKANLRDDYDILQNMALNNKRMKAVYDWIREKQKRTYIRIDESYRGCAFESPGWGKSSTDKN